MFGTNIQNLTSSVLLLEQAGVSPWEAFIKAVQNDTTTFQDYDPNMPPTPLVTEADEVAIEGRIRQELVLVNTDSVRSQKSAVQNLFNDVLSKTWAQMGFTSPLLPELNKLKRMHILMLFLSSVRNQLGTLSTNLGNLASDNDEWDFNAYFAEAPASPANFVLSGISGLEVSLDWDDNAESDLAGYKVYRSLVGPQGPYVLVSGQAPIVDSSFVDTVNSPGYYFYTVSAFSTYGHESKGSTPVIANVA